MAELVCGLQQKKKPEAVPLSDDVIRSRIVDISFNILKEVIEELAASPFPFSVQLDETTDISQYSQFLVFVRYVHAAAIKDEFLFCESSYKGIDVLEVVKIISPNRTLTGKKSFTLFARMELLRCLVISCGATLVKKEAPHIVVTHCYLHRRALATKSLPTSLKEVLSTAVKVINIIRSRFLIHRIFKTFFQEMGSEYEVLPYHHRISLAFKRTSLEAPVRTKDTNFTFFSGEKEIPLLEHFETGDFIRGLTYMADIFNHMNYINLSVQRPEVTIMDSVEKLQNFVSKLSIWKKSVEVDFLADFQILEKVLH
jgi:hypothetical protein